MGREGWADIIKTLLCTYVCNIYIKHTAAHILETKDLVAAEPLGDFGALKVCNGR